MLPLFHEHAQSVAMIRHAMDIVRASVATLNGLQTPVIGFDQPLFTLAKIIQWNWPDSHGETKFGCITRRCKCVKDNIPCTALCACDGECRQ